MAVVSAALFLMVFLACRSAGHVINSDEDDNGSIIISASATPIESDPIINSTLEKQVNAEFAPYFKYVNALLEKASTRAINSPAKSRAVFENGVRKGKPEEWGGHFQGDIVLPSLGRNGVKDPIARWPGGIIHYEFDPKINDESRNLFMSGVDEYKKHTPCLKFLPRKNEQSYIYITDNKDGCYAELGYGENIKRIVIHFKVNSNCS